MVIECKQQKYRYLTKKQLIAVGSEKKNSHF